MTAVHFILYDHIYNRIKNDSKLTELSNKTKNLKRIMKICAEAEIRKNNQIAKEISEPVKEEPIKQEINDPKRNIYYEKNRKNEIGIEISNVQTQNVG